MSISIDVRIDLSGLEGKFDGQAVEDAQQLLAERIMQHCKPLVPKDVGHLRDSGSIGEGGKTIQWTEEYAKYVYNFGENVNYSTEGTCGHWFEKAKQEHLSDWEETVKRCFR